MRESSTARTSWRSAGSNIASRPVPPEADSPSAVLSSMLPSTTRIQARSWTWCSWSCSPAGRLITIARPSDSESSTFGWCGGTSSSFRFQFSIDTRDSISSLRTTKPGCGGAAAAAVTRLMRSMVIAIDGPAGAGKSTVARGVAEALGFTYLDSGAMYRAVALAALRAGIDLDDGDAVSRLARGSSIEFDGMRVLLAGDDVSTEIRDPEVTEAASR